MPFIVRIFLMALVFSLSSGLGMAGGNKPGRVPMGVSGVTLGLARLAANALTSFNSSPDDHYDATSVEDGDCSCTYIGEDDDDEGDDRARAAAYTLGQIEAHRRGRGRSGFGNYWGVLEVEESVNQELHVVPEVDLGDIQEQESVGDERKQEEDPEAPESVLQSRRYSLYPMTLSGEEKKMHQHFQALCFGSESDRDAALEALLEYARSIVDIKKAYKYPFYYRFITPFMDILTSPHPAERAGGLRLTIALLTRETEAFPIEVFLKVLSGHLRYTVKVRWERDAIVWEDLFGLLLEVVRVQESFIHPILDSIIKEVYLHLDHTNVYRDNRDITIMEAIKAFLVNLASENVERKKCVMCALFALFIEENPEARELHPMIPVGTLQEYKVKPIFNIMKAISGNDDHWIEQVLLFSILQENDKFRHALNKCLIQWVREETMPPSVRYQAAIWLAENTGRMFEYGPQSDVLHILLRWAKSGDAGWLSLEQRMGVHAVALVNGCSKHQKRARALICSLGDPETVCCVLMDAISRLRMKKAKVMDYRFDFEFLMESLMERDPELVLALIECAVSRFLDERASGRLLSLGEVNDPLVCLLSSAMAVLSGLKDRGLGQSSLIQLFRIEGVRGMLAEVWVEGVKEVLKDFRSLSEESINWVLSMLKGMSLDILIDSQCMERLMAELQSSESRDAQRLHASIVELQQFLNDFMRGEAFTFRHFMYAIVFINKADEEASATIEWMEAFMSAFNSERP